MSPSVRRVVGAACVVVAILGLAVVRMTLAAADDPGVLSACVNAGNGGMRLVPSAQACHKNETFVQWNVTGPAGPQGPAGQDGEDGADASDGPPYTWVCTPANYDFGNTVDAEVDVFNSSEATANVAAHFLAKDGTNLAGAAVPFSSPAAIYPGQTGNATVTVAPRNTLIVPFVAGGAGSCCSGNRINSNAILASVIVTSDQPVVVGLQVFGGVQNIVTCGRAPK